MRPRASIHVVTDRRRVAPGARTDRQQMDAFDRWLDEVIGAAPDVIQIREPDLDARTLAAVVARVVAATRGGPTQVIVNDRADVARAARADGVHLKADGPPAGRVRALDPGGWLIGRSTHSMADVREAGDADYVFVGTVFESDSKPGVAAVGLARVREAAACGVPVIAIGGIDATKASSVCAAGASGVAAIGLFLPIGHAAHARGPSRAVAALRAAMLE